MGGGPVARREAPETAELHLRLLRRRTACDPPEDPDPREDLDPGARARHVTERVDPKRHPEGLTTRELELLWHHADYGMESLPKANAPPHDLAVAGEVAPP